MGLDRDKEGPIYCDINNLILNVINNLIIYTEYVVISGKSI